MKASGVMKYIPIFSNMLFLCSMARVYDSSLSFFLMAL